jgi:hypothetical protein
MAAEKAAVMGRSVTPTWLKASHSPPVARISVANQAVRRPNSRRANRQERHRRAGDGQPGRQIRIQTQLEGAPDHPVEQRGFLEPGLEFLEPGLSPQPRRDPIAGTGHLAADGGVAGLVGPNHPHRAEVIEIK